MARPSDYTQEMADKVKTYTDLCEDEEIQQLAGLSQKGTELYKNKINVKLPTIEGLSRYLGIHKDTVYEWEKIHPEFSDALSNLRAKQGEVLINKGLSGDYNPTIAKLMLSNNHGYREKTDVTTNGNDLPTPILGGITKDAKN